MALERRELKMTYDPPIGRCWINDNPFETHFLNTYTILIPEGEKFIIRSSSKYLDKLPLKLREETKDLFYQEGQHSIQHAKVVKMLEAEGYTIKPFITLANTIAYKVIEKIEPDMVLLSTCSGIEHINANIAEFFLKNDPLFAGASKDMAKVFAWHFAEEIEHGCVVYDIFNAVRGSYFLRIYGLLCAYLQFIPALYLGAFLLAFQDRSLFRWSFWRGLLAFTFWKGFAMASLASMARYFRPSFHPSQTLRMDLVQKGISYYKQASGDSVAVAPPASAYASAST